MFLLLDRVHFEIMFLAQRSNAFNKYSSHNDSVSFEPYTPASKEDELSAAASAQIAKCLGLSVDVELSSDRQKSIFAHMSNEDVEGLIGRITEEEAPYWPVALHSPLKVLLNELDVPPERYLKWLKRKKLKAPLRDDHKTAAVTSSDEPPAAYKMELEALP